MDFCVIVPQVLVTVLAHTIFMREVVEGTATESPEMVVTALQRTVVRQPSKVPFPNQSRAVTGLFQQRRQCGMLCRQSNISSRAGERLFKSDGQPVLIATRDDGSPACCTDGRIRVGLEEADAFICEMIEVRSFEIRTAVAGKISVAKIIRE